jgi:sugar lactone lactonase YvrE
MLFVENLYAILNTYLTYVNFYISSCIFATATLTLEGQRSSSTNNRTNKQNNMVFISYAREDYIAAERLYDDLERAGLNPWLDKKKLLPGQNWKDEIEDAISKSRYFIPLFSKTSITKIGPVQNEFKFALEVFSRYPPNMIFYIPARLDDCDIPYKELKLIHRADLFPIDDDNIWKEGVEKILQAMEIHRPSNKNVKTRMNSSIEITLTDIYTNPNDMFKFTIIDQPKHGALISSTAANTILYAPNSRFTGTDNFKYKATDKHGKVSNIVTISIKVVPPSPISRKALIATLLVVAVVATIVALRMIPIPVSESLSYQFMKKWGSRGSGDGQFLTPHGIAVDSSSLHKVYVADTGNHRIQKFYYNGTFITKWTSNGIGDNQFHAPQDLTVDLLGNVYVADTGNNAVQEFTGEGKLITDLTTSDPRAIAIDISENVYVANGNDQILKKASDESFFNTWGNYHSFKFASGVGIAIDSLGDVYVADSGNSRIEKFSSNGTLISTWGKPGKENGQFISPSAVAVDKSGNVYVSDTGNHRIQKFDGNGKFITTVGSAGSDDGQFLFPVGVAVDSSGNLYITDRGNNRIQVFSQSANIFQK